MSEKNNGGPAFPEAGLSGLPNGEFIHGQAGMTLRDYFAIHAPEPSEQSVSLQRGIDRGRNPHNESHKPRIRDDDEIKSFLRYRFADSMLQEREK